MAPAGDMGIGDMWPRVAMLYCKNNIQTQNLDDEYSHVQDKETHKSPCSKLDTNSMWAVCHNYNSILYATFCIHDHHTNIPELPSAKKY